MAENAAHLTKTLSQKPSILELFALESLNEILRPATKTLIDFFYQRNSVWTPVVTYFDEIYCCSTSLLQLWYLNKYGSSFAENFYGLRRVSVLEGTRCKLSRKEVTLSLLMLTVFPYLRHKLNAISEDLHFRNVPSSRQAQKERMILFNSFIQISIQVMNFVQHLRYLSGKSDINSPLLWLAGVKLKYAENQQNVTLRNIVPGLLQRFFELSAFVLQFCNWWQSENTQNLGSLPPPPPPDVAIDGDELELNGLCPLCKKERQVETVLAVSGFVFCFSCINAYVQRHERCPVSNIPATFQDLIRVYTPS